MITGRKVFPRKIRTTPPETLVARLSQPHLIPHKDNIFQEIDHNTIGYLDGLAATSTPAFGRDRQTFKSLPKGWLDAVDDDECSCGETNHNDLDVPTTEPSVTNIGVLNVTAFDPIAEHIDLWSKPIGDAIAFYERFIKSVEKMNVSMKGLNEAFAIDLPLDMSPSDEQLRAMVDEVHVVPQVYDGDPEDLTYVKQVSHDYGATWEDAIDTSIRTDDLWRLIFEKYRLLDASMLLRRRDEIDVLFNMMVNQRQVGKIDDELFDSYIRNRQAIDGRKDAIPPKNRPTAGSGSAYQ